MTDFHETNHAAGAGSRHADSVRRKTGAGGDTVIVHAVPQPLRSQGILNDIVPEPSSCAFAEEKQSQLPLFLQLKQPEDQRLNFRRIYLKAAP